MRWQPKPGIRGTRSMLVTESLTVPAMSQAFGGFAEMPPVFATAYMIAFIEWTCAETLKPYLDEGERTVGTHVDVSHGAATPVGMTVTAEVELVAIKRCDLQFRVACRDDFGSIGEGFHERAIVDGNKFLERARRKGEKSVRDI